MAKKLFRITYKAVITCECYISAENEEQARIAFYHKPKQRSTPSKELEREELIVHAVEVKE